MNIEFGTLQWLCGCGRWVPQDPEPAPAVPCTCGRRWTKPTATIKVTAICLDYELEPAAATQDRQASHAEVTFLTHLVSGQNRPFLANPRSPS